MRAEPQVFSPDNDGFEDFTQIYLDCAEIGDLITIKIYDTQGRKVRDLVQNQSVALENTFIRWDGTADDGRKVRIGHYILLVENYMASGELLQSKATLKSILENTKNEELRIKALELSAKVEQLEQDLFITEKDTIDG